jgi:hypothetical protein
MGRRLQTVQMGLNFAPRQRVTTRYCEYVSLNPSLGVISDYVFSANGIYDPNVSGTGHQPLGFDQWMGLYDHYHVVSSTIKATFVPADTTAANAAGVCGITIRDSSASLTGADVTLLLENVVLGNQDYKQLPLVYDRGTICKAHYDASLFHGVSDLLASSILRGDSINNPSEQAFYHVWIGPLSGGLDLSATTILVEIEYTIVFSEPKFQAQS